MCITEYISLNVGPEAGILKTSVLSHIFKGKLFPHALRKEYIELLSKFEVALLLDRNRMLVPSMLPLSPTQTLYHFKTVFPRPPIAYLLQQTRLHSSGSNDFLPPFSSMSDPLVLPVPKSFSAATSKGPELYRTGLLLRRFYFMTYVPSGFWPRLISRFLTTPDFSMIVLKALGFHGKQIDEIIKLMVSGDVSTLVDLEWSYWTTGVEFWYRGYSLLRVAEIRTEGTFQDCYPPLSQSSSYSRTPSIPYEPTEDCEDLSFQLHGQWLAVDQTPTTGLEILVPDHICPSVLEFELPNELGGEESEPHPLPHRESSWMSAQLLSLTVQQIDTLLEDWFPGIGSKDGGKTIYSIPYVNRVVPCPYCVGGADVISNDVFVSMSCADPNHSLHGSDLHIVPSPPATISFLNDAALETNVRRDLMPSLQKTVENSPQSERKRRHTGDNIDDTSTGEASSPLPTSGSLIQASRFGFMIETCVAASRGLETLICPSHPSQPLDISSLTPDLVFGDLPTHFIIDDKLVNQGKFVASGSFGEIYHGAIYPHLSASVSHLVLLPL